MPPLGDVDERHDDPLDLAARDPVRPDLDEVPPAVAVLDLALGHRQPVQDRLGVLDQHAAAELLGQVRERPADVGRPDVEVLPDVGREPLDAEPAVQEQRGDLGRRDQVLQVARRLGQLVDLGLELVVDRLELLGHRLRLLLGGLELLGRAPELLVHRLKLLVLGPQLLPARLELLDGHLKLLPGLLELVGEHLDLARVLGRDGGRGRDVEERDLDQAGRLDRRHPEPDGPVAAQPDRPRLDRPRLAARLEQGRLDGRPQLRHDQPDDALGRVAAGHLEVRPDAVREVDHVVRRVDEHARRRRGGPLPLVERGDGRGLVGLDRLAVDGLRAAEPVDRRDVGERRRRLTADVDPGGLVDRREQLGRRVGRLARAQEQPAAGDERVVEQLEHAALEPALEVDQQVPARDQVEPGERRVLEQAVRGEQDPLAQALGHLVPTGHLAEKAPEPFGAHVGLDGPGVDPGPGRLDRVLGQVGREHLEPDRPVGLRRPLGQQHRDRVRLLARGAPGHPDPDLAPGLLEQPGQHVPLEHAERGGVSEEVGDVDEQVVEEPLGLGRVLAQVAEVGRERVGADHVEPSLQSSQDGGALVVGEVVAGPGAQQRQDVADGLDVVAGVPVARQPDAVEPVGVVDDLAAQPVGRGRVVHDARGERAPGHLVELGVGGVLGQHQPADLLDPAGPDGPVLARPGQDHGDGPLAPSVRERPEKVVDGPPLVAGVGERLDVEVAVGHDQVAVGRDHVDVAALDLGAPGHLGERERDRPGQDLRQLALPVGREVDHDDERGPVGLGQPGEERLQRAQPTGRGAQADDEERVVRGVHTDDTGSETVRAEWYAGGPHRIVQVGHDSHTGQARAAPWPPSPPAPLAGAPPEPVRPRRGRPAATLASRLPLGPGPSTPAPRRRPLDAGPGR